MSALRNVKRSIALASGLVRGAGRHGKSVGPYVCATVELRIDDLRALVSRVEELERALLSIVEGSHATGEHRRVAADALSPKRAATKRKKR